MGKLIVLEGTDGSGKTTQWNRLLERLESEGVACRTLDFPRYGEPSCAPVELYLNGALGEHPDDVNAYAASALFAVDRYCSYKQDWGAFYESGGLLLANRYTTSNAVHQASKLSGAQRRAFLDWLFDFEYRLLGLPAPDLVFYLDVPTALTERMMREREVKKHTHADIHERDLAYLRACRDAAGDLIAHYGWRAVACAHGGEMRSVEDIHEEIFAQVRELL